MAMEQERRLDMGKYGLNVGSPKICPKKQFVCPFYALHNKGRGHDYNGLLKSIEM